MTLIEQLRASLQELKERNHPAPYYCIITKEDADNLRASMTEMLTVEDLSLTERAHQPAVGGAKLVGKLFGDLFVYEPIDGDWERLQAERHLHSLIQEKLKPFVDKTLTPDIARIMLHAIRDMLLEYKQSGAIDAVPSIVAMSRDGVIMFTDEQRAPTFKEQGWLFLAAV